MVLSTPVVYSSDGKITMKKTYIFLALFLVFGLLGSGVQTGFINLTSATPISINQPPIAIATSNITGGDTIPLVVEFRGYDSYDPDNDPLTYHWDLGDGNFVNNANANHTYFKAGVFTAQFSVSDGYSVVMAKPIVIQVGVTPSPTPSLTPSITPSPSTTPTPTPSLTPTPMPAPSPTPSPTVLGSPIPMSSTTWPIRSVSSMKITKDMVCGQPSQSFIDSWITKAIELGVNYISIETPYDNPTCGNSVAYTKLWADAIHSRGLNVWHRHMPLAFEGIYNTAKITSVNYLSLISDYIKANPTIFKNGDIFTPIPEPQNGGIRGITYCPQGICIFSDVTTFNTWLRDAISISNTAFNNIGLGGKIKIGYYGLDGFVVWGDNNPDWHGILEDSTVQAMGNITIDHYPELVGDTMANDLNEIQAKYPNIPIVIGEWGTVTSTADPVAQVNNSMQAALRPNVVGFNYWHMGMGGNEALVNFDFSNRPQFDAVKSFFTR